MTSAKDSHASAISAYESPSTPAASFAAPSPPLTRIPFSADPCPVRRLRSGCIRAASSASELDVGIPQVCEAQPEIGNTNTHEPISPLCFRLEEGKKNHVANRFGAGQGHD